MPLGALMNKMETDIVSAPASEDCLVLHNAGIIYRNC
jgi:hypothetical protein